MKVKTSITLSADLLRTLKRVAAAGESRSEVIERLVRASLADDARAAADRRDRALLDANADRLNDQMTDVLGVQAEP